MKPRMQFPWIFALLPSLLLVTSPTLGQELERGDFETWSDVGKLSQPEKAPNQGRSGSSSLASHAGQIENQPFPNALRLPYSASPNTMKDGQEDEYSEATERSRKGKGSSLIGSLDDQLQRQYFIRFGAGASWMVPTRLSDMANSERLMSEFYISWAPAGMIAEVGLDLGISRDNVFDLKPNLKFFLLSNRWFSVYLEAGCDVMFLSEGKEVGANAGVGFILGIIDNLALEIKASTAMFSLSQQGASHLLELGDESADANTSNLTIFPSLTARIAARF